MPEGIVVGGIARQVGAVEGFFRPGEVVAPAVYFFEEAVVRARVLEL